MSQTNDLTGRTVLVTGASGFLGSRTVAILTEQGCSVHALVRKTSRTDHLQLPDVTIFYGDVADIESLQPAFEGIDYVVHAAADTSGNEEAGKLSTILGTRNILTLCERHKVRKLVYISSCSVYGVTDYKPGQKVNESSSLERYPEKRGAYSHSKLKAEELITRAMKNETVPVVCLRPGTIYGPGGEIYTAMMGFSLGKRFFVIIGDGSFVLPLVYVDNLVDAIVIAIKTNISDNKIYNVVDPVKVTKKEYVERVIKKLYPNSRTLYLPFNLLKTIVSIQSRFFSAINRKPLLTEYRLISSQKNITYDVSKITRELSWRPPVSVERAFGNLIDHEKRQPQILLESEKHELQNLSHATTQRRDVKPT